MPTTQKRVNSEVLFEFFLTFSRFEYALKASNYFKRLGCQRNDPLGPPEAMPDWDSFAVSLRDTFLKDRNQELQRACEYILDSPPWKQVIINDSVAWETPVRPKNESDIEFLLRMVRCIRNNLFHGGKHNIKIHEQTERTEQLLRSSLTILNECLTLSSRVKDFFDQAKI